MIRLSHAAAAGAVVLALLGAAPANAVSPRSEERATTCYEPTTHGADARGSSETDTRSMTVDEQNAIEQQTAQILAAEGSRTVSHEVPVYVHVMMDAAGNGNVTDQQIVDQVAVLNKTYGGKEDPAAANTGFSFTLAGVDRWYNDTWHRDGQSNYYRSYTRQGGADALNIWLVDFKYLGVATFPWDYAQQGKVDGIRVLYASLPGGTERNYNLGETATHEAGHWLGLYHTFQNGCTKEGDEVADTPAQSIATNGCPEGQDSCPSEGLDPIHNYMDYSYDSCYNQFTPGQSVRMNDMWAAYRA